MRPKAFFVNGGAGRVVCSIPAFEKYQEENPDEDFLIVCEGGTDFIKGHPSLYPRVYDHWHKNLFRDKLKDMDIVTTEPYRIWEYYNQKCNLSQAFDIQINGKGIRELPKPTIKLSRQEYINGKFVMEDVRQKTKKDKIVVFQPFGRGTQVMGNFITDPSGRSFEMANIVNLIKKLQRKYAVVYMGEIEIDFTREGCKEPVAAPRGVDLRAWAGIIGESDLFIGCDSVGQHMAYSLDIPAVVVVGSTCKENISYPNCDKFEVLDMGEGMRIYDPIRITMDEVTQRVNDGIMAMNDKIEDVIIQSVDKLMNKYYVKKKETVILPSAEQQNQSCGAPPSAPMSSLSAPTGSPEMILSPTKQKKTTIDDLMGDALKSSNGVKKASGFLDSIQK
jgi:ADP-heptose:LPS heptosyltransferase